MQAHRLVLLFGLIASCTTPAGAQTTSAAPANVFLLASQLQAAKAAAANQGTSEGWSFMAGGLVGGSGTSAAAGAGRVAEGTAR